MNDGPIEWKLAGASVIGTQHEDAGGRCEDAWHVVRATGQAALAVGVSDGAGSASMGHRGAEITCRVVSSWLAENMATCLEQPSEVTRRQLCEAVTRAIEETAAKESTSPRSFACTLIALAVCRDGRWIAAHLGDGAVVAVKGNQAAVLSLPQKGEFANETFFITDDDAVDNLRIVTSSSEEDLSMSSFFLFTDGLESSLVNRHTGQVAPVLSKIATWLGDHTEAEVTRALEEQITQVLRQRTTDDCTIVVVTAVAGRQF